MRSPPYGINCDALPKCVISASSASTVIAVMLSIPGNRSPRPTVAR